MIETLLADLESRINPQEEKRLLAQWIEFLEGRFTGSIFRPMRNYLAPPRLDWPSVSVNRTLDDQEAMAIQQFAGVSGCLDAGNGAILNIRSNYGTSTMASLFGVEPFIMDEKLNTLPTSLPMPGGIDAVRAALYRGVPDVHSALCGKTLEMNRRFIEMMQPYPNISEFVHIYHPDAQGPIDICEVLCGSEFFYYLYDYPDLMKQFIEMITETYIRFMREWSKIVAPKLDQYSAHWGMLHKGRIVLRNDSLMNLSEEMYVEFVRPFDQRIFDELGGGMVHYCGKGDHFASAMSEMNGLYSVNVAQPHLNDMECVFQHTVDKGISILGLAAAWVRENRKSTPYTHGLVHAQ